LVYRSEDQIHYLTLMQKVNCFVNLVGLQRAETSRVLSRIEEGESFFIQSKAFEEIHSDLPSLRKIDRTRITADRKSPLRFQR
jgi:hypothetical protein